jgi:hypothetical protein
MDLLFSSNTYARQCIASTPFLSALCKWRQSSSSCDEFVTSDMFWRKQLQQSLSSFSRLQLQNTKVQQRLYQSPPLGIIRATFIQLRSSQTIVVLSSQHLLCSIRLLWKRFSHQKIWCIPCIYHLTCVLNPSRLCILIIRLLGNLYKPWVSSVCSILNIFVITLFLDAYNVCSYMKLSKHVSHSYT